MSLSASAMAVTNDDFIALQSKLEEYIAQNPDVHIPMLVRNSFHDLFLQDKGGLHGCIVKPEFFSNFENVGLDVTNKDIKNLVKTNFPTTGFAFGDVIAFAGKVAIESALPCVNVDFKFNRDPCNMDPQESNRAPSPFIDTIDQLGPMIDYLGGGLTAEDIAILSVGGHAIKGADAAESGWHGIFATVSSGKDFIATTFSSTWKGISKGTLFEFFTGETFDPKSSIIRLPTDMIFFPSKVPAGSKVDKSTEAKDIESKLRSFVDQDSSVFDTKFAQVYSKMLAIGGGNETFISNKKSDQCPQQTLTPPTSTTTPPTTTQIISDTSIITPINSHVGMAGTLPINTGTTTSKTCPPNSTDCALSGSNTIIPHLGMLLVLIYIFLE